jgi:hypothetical protein
MARPSPSREEVEASVLADYEAKNAALERKGS